MYRSSYDPEAADVHYNENVVGKFANEVGRGKLCIATKLFPRLHGDSDMTVENAMASLDSSLGRLGLSKVDIWYLHIL